MISFDTRSSIDLKKGQGQGRGQVQSIQETWIMIQIS